MQNVNRFNWIPQKAANIFFKHLKQKQLMHFGSKRLENILNNVVVYYSIFKKNILRPILMIFSLAFICPHVTIETALFLKEKKSAI